jgi:hypothetical protein
LPTTAVPDDRARRQWDRITARPDTAEQHAAILEARRLHARHNPPDYPHMVAAYQRAIDNRTFAHLDKLTLTSSELTYLDEVVCAATDGLPASRLPAPVRTALHQPLLIACIDANGTQTWPSDTTGTVRALLFGVAVARATRSRPLPLSATEAVALAKLEADGTCETWPGSIEGQRVAQYWTLVTVEGGRFRLTASGRATLNEHRRNSPADTIIPTWEQSQVLAYLSRLDRTGGDLHDHPRDKIKVCVNRQWIVRSGQVKGARRPLYRITESGRDALSRWIAQQKRNKREMIPATAPRLAHGMVVRLMNRKIAGIAPDWVIVDRTARVAHPGTNPTWEVWVTDEPGGEPYLYGGRGFHPSTRYEVHPTGDVSAAA